ncbi:hypothetical protein DFH07DRAFT_941242 [Mycena maculata]|uniref:Uncharacterized protein n=1 Tax=Mycena maculata TaxID=230809 RepID=A0AAD7NBS0_9AGAR|nr:hypothetical protein DFH07DRAFT_941242 [Mycena maculata]
MWGVWGAFNGTEGKAAREKAWVKSWSWSAGRGEGRERVGFTGTAERVMRGVVRYGTARINVEHREMLGRTSACRFCFRKRSLWTVDSSTPYPCPASPASPWLELESDAIAVHSFFEGPGARIRPGTAIAHRQLRVHFCPQLVPELSLKSRKHLLLDCRQGSSLRSAFRVIESHRRPPIMHLRLGLSVAPINLRLSYIVPGKMKTSGQTCSAPALDVVVSIYRREAAVRFGVGDDRL